MAIYNSYFEADFVHNVVDVVSGLHPVIRKEGELALFTPVSASDDISDVCVDYCKVNGLAGIQVELITSNEDQQGDIKFLLPLLTPINKEKYDYIPLIQCIYESKLKLKLFSADTNYSDLTDDQQELYTFENNKLTDDHYQLIDETIKAFISANRNPIFLLEHENEMSLRKVDTWLLNNSRIISKNIKFSNSTNEFCISLNDGNLVLSILTHNNWCTSTYGSDSAPMYQWILPETNLSNFDNFKDSFLKSEAYASIIYTWNEDFPNNSFEEYLLNFHNAFLDALPFVISFQKFYTSPN